MKKDNDGAGPPRDPFHEQSASPDPDPRDSDTADPLSRDREVDPSEDAGVEDEGEGAALHQPASSADLNRFPPTSARCARVRGLLRDYADHELAVDERESVDEHVHACRDCAVALSRAEAEVYRLRRALKVGAPIVSSSFVDNVMASVRTERVAEGSPSVQGGAVSADFTPRVMERIRREWRRPSLRERASTLVRRHAMSLVVVAAVAVLAVSLRLGGGKDALALHVVTAEDAVLLRGGGGSRLVAGATLLPGDSVRAGARGRVAIVVPDGEAAAGQATLEVDPETELSIRARGDAAHLPLFRLIDGALAIQVRAGADLVFAVNDRCRIELESGMFSVFAERVARHDGSLAAGSTFTSVRLAAIDGRAHVVRGGSARATVEPGFAALFDDWSAIAFERCFNDTEFRTQRERVPARDIAVSPRATVPDWLGRVINGTNNAGVVGVSVTLRRPGEEARTVFTGGDGTFRLDGLGEVEGAVAMVEVTLPEGSSSPNLANFAGPITLRSIGVGPREERLLAPIALPAERRVMGTVRDPNGRLLAGARISAVAVDALAGAAKRLAPLVADVFTGVDGRFVLHRLPATMPKHVDVVLLVEHNQFGPVAACELVGEVSLADLTIEVAMVRRDRVAIEDLPPGQTVEILSSIRNLSPSVMMHVSAVAVGASGNVEVDVSEDARLWLRHGDVLVPLAAHQGLPATLQRGSGAVPTQVAALAKHSRGRRAGVVALGRGRYDLVATGGGEQRTVALVDHRGNDLAGAELFVVSKTDGRMEYLGQMTSAQAEWAMPTGSNYDVVAVTEDGSVGVADTSELQENVLRVRVMAPGSVQLPQDLIVELKPAFEQRGGFMVFELHMLEPLRDYVVYRHAGRDSGFEMRGLIPGTYRLTTPDGRNYIGRVPPGGLGQLNLGDAGQTTRR